ADRDVAEAIAASGRAAPILGECSSVDVRVDRPWAIEAYGEAFSYRHLPPSGFRRVEHSSVIRARRVEPHRTEARYAQRIQLVGLVPFAQRGVELSERVLRGG